MGWTSYHANYYKNGTVDRKRECDAYFLEGLNRGHYNILASSLIGTTYYAAVEILKKGQRDKQGNIVYMDVPKEDRVVFAVVFLTKTNMKDYYNFSYKVMDETVGPAQVDCPKKILDLLTPTDSDYAIAWRDRCLMNIQNKKLKATISNIPIGTVIRFTSVNGVVYTLEKMAPSYQFRTPWFYDREKNVYISKRYIPEDFEIIRKF